MNPAHPGSVKGANAALEDQVSSLDLLLVGLGKLVDAVFGWIPLLKIFFS